MRKREVAIQMSEHEHDKSIEYRVDPTAIGRMMMKTQEMKNLILQALSEILCDTDFCLKKSDDAFIRKIPDGRQTLGMGFWNFNPKFQFQLMMCIRLEAAEEMYHRFSRAAPKYYSLSDTTITRLEYFTGGPHKYTVTTAEDVASVVGSLAGVIRGKVIPFFNEHQDVKALDRAVNNQEPGIDITQSPGGPMHAIILAYLAENADFDKIVAKQRDKMELAADVPHPFNSLIDYLKTHMVSKQVG